MFGIPLHLLSVWYKIQSRPSTWAGWEGSSRKGLPVDGVENSSRRGATTELNLTCTMLEYDVWASISYLFFDMFWNASYASEIFPYAIDTFWSISFTIDMFRTVSYAIDIQNAPYVFVMPWNYHMSSICSLCQWYAPITFPRLYEQNVLRTIWHCNSAFKQNMLLFHLVSLLCILIPHLFENCPLCYGYVSHLLSFICSPRCYINFSG